jgi:hypothetical protein
MRWTFAIYALEAVAVLWILGNVVVVNWLR